LFPLGEVAGPVFVTSRSACAVAVQLGNLKELIRVFQFDPVAA
jgi:hypothetical protein